MVQTLFKPVLLLYVLECVDQGYQVLFSQIFGVLTEFSLQIRLREEEKLQIQEFLLVYIVKQGNQRLDVDLFFIVQLERSLFDGLGKLFRTLSEYRKSSDYVSQTSGTEELDFLFHFGLEEFVEGA